MLPFCCPVNSPTTRQRNLVRTDPLWSKIDRQHWSPGRKSDQNTIVTLFLACSCSNRFSSLIFLLFLIE